MAEGKSPNLVSSSTLLVPSKPTLTVSHANRFLSIVHLSTEVSRRIGWPPYWFAALLDTSCHAMFRSLRTLPSIINRTPLQNSLLRSMPHREHEPKGTAWLDMFARPPAVGSPCVPISHSFAASIRHPGRCTLVSYRHLLVLATLQPNISEPEFNVAVSQA